MIGAIKVLENEANGKRGAIAVLQGEATDGRGEQIKLEKKDSA